MDLERLQQPSKRSTMPRPASLPAFPSSPGPRQEALRISHRATLKRRTRRASKIILQAACGCTLAVAHGTWFLFFRSAKTTSSVQCSVQGFQERLYDPANSCWKSANPCKTRERISIKFAKTISQALGLGEVGIG